MEHYCQSCGMPMPKEELFGINTDGSQNEEYCTYCYEQGKFTQECSMEEMIQHCAQFVDEFNKEMEKPISKEEAIAFMRQEFPKLKRWKKINS